MDSRGDCTSSGHDPSGFTEGSAALLEQRLSIYLEIAGQWLNPDWRLGGCRKDPRIAGIFIRVGWPTRRDWHGLHRRPDVRDPKQTGDVYLHWRRPRSVHGNVSCCRKVKRPERIDIWR